MSPVPERPARTSLSHSVAAAVGSSRLLAGASFEQILVMSPALAIRAIPLTDRAELRVTRPGDPGVAASTADRDATRPGAVSRPGSHVVCLPIALRDRAGAGELRLFTGATGGFDAAAVVVAEIVASQIEAALDQAFVDGNPGPAWGNEATMGRRRSYDTGVATGLVMASHGLDREAAYEVLRGIGQNTNRTVAEVAAQLIQVAESGAHPPQLRLVDSTRTKNPRRRR